MLQELPETACNIIVEHFLTGLEVKTLRLVSKGLKHWIDTNLTRLKPREFLSSQVIYRELVDPDMMHSTSSAPVLHGLKANSRPNLAISPTQCAFHQHLLR